jgi:hypothetical protein
MYIMCCSIVHDLGPQNLSDICLEAKKKKLFENLSRYIASLLFAETKQMHQLRRQVATAIQQVMLHSSVSAKSSPRRLFLKNASLDMVIIWAGCLIMKLWQAFV